MPRTLARAADHDLAGPGPRGRAGARPGDGRGATSRQAGTRPHGRAAGSAAVHSSPAARSSASVVLPTPAGPTSRTACGARPGSSPRPRASAAGWPRVRAPVHGRRQADSARRGLARCATLRGGSAVAGRVGAVRGGRSRVCAVDVRRLARGPTLRRRGRGCRVRRLGARPQRPRPSALAGRPRASGPAWRRPGPRSPSRWRRSRPSASRVVRRFGAAVVDAGVGARDRPPAGLVRRYAGPTRSARAAVGRLARPGRGACASSSGGTSLHGSLDERAGAALGRADRRAAAGHPGRGCTSGPRARRPAGLPGPAADVRVAVDAAPPPPRP